MTHMLLSEKKKKMKEKKSQKTASIRNAIKQLSFACRVGFVFKFKYHIFSLFSLYIYLKCVCEFMFGQHFAFLFQIGPFFFFISFSSIALQYACIFCFSVVVVVSSCFDVIVFSFRLYATSY